MNHEANAEKYLNFSGSFGTDPYKNIGGADAYGGNMGYPYSNASGDNNSLGSLDDADRTLTVTITNDGTSGNPSETAIVFGSYTNPTLTQPTGCSVVIQESSHEQVRAEVGTNPMFVLGLKYIVTNVAQFSNIITIFTETSRGMFMGKKFRALSWRSSLNQIPTQIDAPTYGFTVDGRTRLEVPINANEQVDLILFIKTAGDITNVLRGKGVLDMAKDKAPTGFLPADLERVAR